MADEHSFDVVSKVDLQEVSNAVQQALKEMGQRFDFRGSKSNIELDKTKNEILLTSDDEYRLKSVIDMLQSKLIKRQVPLKALSYGKVEPAASNTVKQIITLQQGIPTEKAKEIVKIIKDAVAAAPADEGLDSSVERRHSQRIVGSHTDADEGDAAWVYFRSRNEIVDTGLARNFVIGTCFNSL